MAIPGEAVAAARPFVTSFMARRGFAVRGQEAEVLIGYVLKAAAPHILAELRELVEDMESQPASEIATVRGIGGVIRATMKGQL